MVESDPDRTALRFVNEINRHDVTVLLELMAPDIRYIDHLGQEVRGKERMAEVWSALFGRFPDLHIVIRDHLTLGPVVGLFGVASGTATDGGENAPATRWSMNAAWRAVVRDGRVEEWQVYFDDRPIRTLREAHHA